MKIPATIFAILIVLISGWYFYGSFNVLLSGDENNTGNIETVQNGGVGQNLEGDKFAEIADKVKVVTINKEIVVLMTAERFIPSSITLNIGDSLKFINQDSRAHWPAADIHPTHLCYPGFDSMGGVKPSESFFFKFTSKKSCGFHDHLNPSLKGNVDVQ